MNRYQEISRSVVGGGRIQADKVKAMAHGVKLPFNKLLLVKLLTTEEKVRTGHVTKKLTLGSCGDQRNEGGTVYHRLF